MWTLWMSGFWLRSEGLKRWFSGGASWTAVRFRRSAELCQMSGQNSEQLRMRGMPLGVLKSVIKVGVFPVFKHDIKTRSLPWIFSVRLSWGFVKDAASIPYLSLIWKDMSFYIHLHVASHLFLVPISATKPAMITCLSLGWNHSKKRTATWRAEWDLRMASSKSDDIFPQLRSFWGSQQYIGSPSMRAC